jgi:tetratricopeptide (TPR) repeat protein
MEGNNMRNPLPLLLLTAVLAVWGCRRAAEPVVDQSRELWARTQQLYERGATNEVVQVLVEAMHDSRLANVRADVLRELLRAHLSMGDAASARKAYLAAAKDSKEIAVATFGIVEAHLRGAGLLDDLESWCEELLAQQLPQPIPEQLYAQIATLARERGDVDGLLDAYGRCGAGLPADAALRVLSQSIADTLNAGETGTVARAVEFLSQRFAQQSAFAPMIVETRVRLLLKQTRLDEAAETLLGALSSLPDTELSRASELTVLAAAAAGRRDLADRVCSAVLDAKPVDSQPFQTAGRRWVLLARDAGELPEAHRRLAALNARLPRADSMLRLCSDLIYLVMDKGDAATKTGMLDLCDALRARAESDQDKAWAATLTLDACFMTESFGKALEVLTAGIPGRDASWHEMLIVKVKAHKALQDKKVEEAIGHFREFMGLVGKSEEDMVDPSSNLRVPNESVLGLNAVRIGNLWASIGQTEKAQAAFEEARGYYRAAAGKAPAGSEERRQAEEGLKGVPGTVPDAKASAEPAPGA